MYKNTKAKYLFIFLQKEDLTPEEYQLRRANMLNAQQLEMANLDRRQAREQTHAEQNATTDWEVSPKL